MGFLEFLKLNYIWILVVLILLIITIIGFFADRRDKKKKKEKNNLAKNDAPLEVPNIVNIQGGNNISNTVPEMNTNMPTMEQNNIAMPEMNNNTVQNNIMESSNIDNTINLISTDDEITFEEEEDIEDKVDEIMTSSRVDKSMKDSISKEKLKKKDASKQDFNLKKKEMYKHKNKLMKNETDENIVLYKNGMSVAEFANVLNEFCLSGSKFFIALKRPIKPS